MTDEKFRGDLLRQRYADDPVAIAMIGYIEELLSKQDVLGFDSFYRYFSSSGTSWWNTGMTTTASKITVGPTTTSDTSTVSFSYTIDDK